MFWQRTHRRRMEELIRSAKTDYPVSQEYVERVSGAIEGADVPVRGRSRRKLVAIAAAVLVVLVGLGFVPFPAGGSKGALERALTAAENATTVHIRTWRRPPNGSDGTTTGETTMDEWLSEEGLWRRSCRSREAFSLELVIGPWKVSYQEEGGKPTSAYEMYNPCYLHPADMPDRDQFNRKFDQLHLIAGSGGQVGPEVDFSEHRDASLWGGYVDVVEARLKVGDASSFCFGGPYGPTDQILATAEIDEASNRLISVREYKLVGARREQTYQADYEWDVEIPDELKSFDLPAGTKLTRSTWWETRADQAIVQADTRDWTVTLHSVDVNRSGDILLSLSRVETPDSEMPSVYNSAPRLFVEARGNGGEEYTQQNYFGCFNARHSGYWTTTLKPANAESRPRSITLTIWPYKESPSEDQSVTFRNIPVPPRQDVDDVMAASTEVIQY